MDSEYSDSEDGDYKGMLLSWKYAARAKSLTCSPLAADRIICMDLNCEGCGKNGVDKVHGNRGRTVFVASDLEWVVVNSFALVDPASGSVFQPEFHNWTLLELNTACFGTDCQDATRACFYKCEESAFKLRMYVSSFDGAASVLSEERSAVERPLRLHTLEETVGELSNGIDPIVYVLMMKKRIEKMSRRMTILKNTANVWKSTAENSEKKCYDLERKIRFLKKR